MTDPGSIRESTDEIEHLLSRSGTGSHTESDRKRSIMEMKAWLSQISIPVYILVMMFAIASWIDINGLWVELPLLVEELPEAWNLPSYLAVIIQVANIGPLIYTVANRCAPHKVKEWPVVYLIILIGAVACLLLAFFWDHTIHMLGTERSVPLIVLSSFLALVDCTSSVVFLPYMAIFKPQYMTAFYIGEGLSGLVPGLVGLVQGVGSDPECQNKSVIIHNATTGINETVYEIVAVYKPPLFSVEVFFFFLFIMICVSGLAFTILNFTEFCQRETITTEHHHVSYDKPVNTAQGVDGFDPDVDDGREYGAVTVHSKDQVIEPEFVKGLNMWQFAFLLGITGWVNALTNGILPSTQSYSSLPYSNMVYTLTVRLSTVANPLACFIALFLPTKSLGVVMGLSMLGTGLSGYQLYLAALSPNPPLLGEWTGDFLAVSIGRNYQFCDNILRSIQYYLCL